jgi:uncharacterized delta-60 repeat protein
MTFDDDGRVITDFDASAVAVDLAIQRDGRIVVTGSIGAGFAVARYNSDGSPDTSFGSDGNVITTIGTGYSEANGVAIQSDGKIVIAGLSKGTSETWDFTLARYGADGAIDPSFGSDGVVTTDFGNTHDYLNSIAIQANGKIVVAGSSYQADTDSDFALARYNTDGSLDAEFGESGTVLTDFAGDYDTARGVAIQADGKIVAAGGARSRNTDQEILTDFALARYDGGEAPQHGIDWLVLQVERLINDSRLNDGQGNSLLTKLEGSVYQLDRDNLTSAINKLEAFIYEINALVNSGALTDEEGLPLIEATDNIIDELLAELLIG